MASRLLASLTIVALAGCAGGTRQSPLLPAVSNGRVSHAFASRATGTLIMRVTLPRSGVVPHYVGPSTKGMTVNIKGPTNVKETVGLKVTAKGCKSKLMSLVCTLEVPGLASCPSKNNCYTGSVTTYDAYKHGKIPHNAHALSEDLKFDFSIGSSPTVVPMVLYGIPKTVNFLPSGSLLTGSQTSGFIEPKCSATKQTVHLVASDADGNFIVGVGAPKITLKSDDPSQLNVTGGKNGTFTLSPPAAPGYPFGGHTVHFAAKATPPKSGGGKSVTANVSVSYSGDICGVITEFAIPGGSSDAPFGITSGPDGALWFTEATIAKIGRITTAGTFSQFSGLSASSQPLAIATGPDRNLWITEELGSKIARITTAGTVTEFPTLTGSAAPVVIAPGPDGRMWFTERDANKIAAITTAGSMIEYPVPTASSTLQAIATGPDGALYFTELATGKIGRITTTGTVTETNIPTANSGPIGIATGADGRVWFTESGTDKIGRLTPGFSGATISSEFPLPETGAQALIDTLGPDGNIWFTEQNGNRVDKIDLDGRITEYAVPTGASAPGFIVTGPDGALWFTEIAAGKIGRLR